LCGGMRVWRMRTGISIMLISADRRQLEAIGASRKAPQKHVWRAEIVLLSAPGVGTVEIMRRTGKSKDLCVALAGALHTGGRRGSCA
jgi:hypothetical protein